MLLVFIYIICITISYHNAPVPWCTILLQKCAHMCRAHMCAFVSQNSVTVNILNRTDTNTSFYNVSKLTLPACFIIHWLSRCWYNKDNSVRIVKTWDVITTQMIRNNISIKEICHKIPSHQAKIKYWYFSNKTCDRISRMYDKGYDPLKQKLQKHMVTSWHGRVSVWFFPLKIDQWCGIWYSFIYR